jgi:hypothetical protein
MERDALLAELADRGTATRVRPAETSGYGSHAHWRGQENGR